MWDALVKACTGESAWFVLSGFSLVPILASVLVYLYRQHQATLALLRQIERERIEDERAHAARELDLAKRGFELAGTFDKQAAVWEQIRGLLASAAAERAEQIRMLARLHSRVDQLFDRPRSGREDP